MPGVLVVDDDAFSRVTVSGLLRSLGMEDVVEAGTVADAMRIADDTRPSIAVLDLDLGEGPTGVDLAHGLRRIDGGMAIVMLTSYADPTHAGQHRPLPTGVAYVVKSELTSPQVLATAIDDALAGDPRQMWRPRGDLNAAQWETMRLIAAGYTNAEIARRKQLTEDAVNKAVTRLVRALALEPADGENVRVLIAREYFQRTGTVSRRRD